MPAFSGLLCKLLVFMESDYEMVSEVLLFNIGCENNSFMSYCI